ncbi:hypothetical protein [Pseudotenacibaculum haliotis]|uniref:Uncharacterized protein n=1 Tax=Pseudotenacibaculum haliotis TaxID=1862138 RepID=A0ABW5LVC9_9FLAO
MAKKTKAELKKYFETGDKPSESQYAELIDAFRHTDDKLPIADVDSLQASLDSKASSTSLLDHINDTSLHQSNMSGADIKTAYESEADTNAFTDAEKQQVADGALHRADNNSHVSSAEKTKWNNPLKQYEANEVLSADMGDTYRIFNGSLYKYIGDFPNTNTYTTSDLNAELAEDPARWMDVLSTFPPVEFSVLSPRAIAPNTTRFIQVDAANIKIGTTLDFGPDINVLSYQYLSDKKMLVEIQSNGNYGDVFPKINNGKEVTLSEQFSISDGDIYVPNTLDTDWMLPHNELIYDVGSWESQVSGGKYVGYFSEIPTDRDFTLSMRIHQTADPASQMYFGFKTDPTSAHPNSNSDYTFRLYPNTDSFTNPGVLSWTPGSFFEIKRIEIPNTNSATLEFYVDGVLGSYTTVNITGNWHPFFYTYTSNKVSELELKIL